MKSLTLMKKKEGECNMTKNILQIEHLPKFRILLQNTHKKKLENVTKQTCSCHHLSVLLTHWV
jgi:hypothetical protein